MTRSLGELYDYAYVCTILHSQRLRRTTRGKNSIQNNKNNYGEEQAVTLGERFWGRYATFCYQTDSKNWY